MSLCDLAALTNSHKEEGEDIHKKQFPFPVCREKGTLQWNPKVNETRPRGV